MLKGTLKNRYDQFAGNVYSAGRLSQKEKELIAYACSIMIDCKHCMKYHLAKALESGASSDEIDEAAAITMTVAAGKNRGISEEIEEQAGL